MKITLIENSQIILEQVVHKKSVIIGRSHNSDISVQHEHLSRKHCTIEEDNGEYFITDHTSSNGVHISGVRIPPETRTPFSSFLQLTFGVIECQVSSETEPVPRASQVTTSGKIERPKPRTSTKLTKMHKSDTTSKNFALPFFGLLIILGAIYYYSQTEEQVVVESTTNEKVTAAPSLPTEAIEATPAIDPNKDLAVVFEKFSTNPYVSTYRDKNKIKNCQFYNDICKKLSLSEIDQEGIDIEDSELYVFISPIKQKENPLFEKIRESSNENELIGLHTILNSVVFQQFEANEYKQIHLIIIGSNGLKSVFRFNHNVFSSYPHLKNKLNNELTSGLSTGNLEGFWQSAKISIYQQNF